MNASCNGLVANPFLLCMLARLGQLFSIAV